MLIDTHCHLDAQEFDSDRQQVIERAQDVGVRGIIIPAIAPSNFETVRQLAHTFKGGAYALGIHPICVPLAQETDLIALESAIQENITDPRLVAIGEIGLDYFIPDLKTPAMRAKQEHYYIAQLDLAQRYQLPVLIHVRRSHDILLKHLRRRAGLGGIAHAFNGSFQQATQFMDQGFALGMGGAMTFARALQIRRLAQQLPLDALVLETDAPDIPPAWLGSTHNNTDINGLVNKQEKQRNEPAEITKIADCLVELRGLCRVELLSATYANTQRVLPRFVV